ncbi:uncharacterized protein [Aegilops tauschii subsp. strangulata]|uniref:uncharacterized protein n=1 Tax=Aegilops tauschii subsp. strangulata TaxID=200361 RepID=UPI003CC848BE
MLSNQKKKDPSAAAYYNKMKGYADAMASVGKPLSNEEVLGYMLAGLGSEYEPLVASITSRDEPVSLASFYVYLISAKLRLEQQTSTGEIFSSANAAARGGGRGGQGQGRGCGGRNRNKPTCQVCQKYGHDALRCRQRFNRAYQAEDNRERYGNTERNNNASNTGGHGGYSV